ncbi:SDR family oxidoreductase [Devosia submarina]|uniref:SDR family oxidoreductase n=1 Tax=Devosia submarina TaxID=1173082 RepID=UPI000D36B16E|nr:SDR family oxidoreductase [Devosia submarina]
MAQSISGRVAVVTGASSGIGRAAARALAAEGARVALVARSTEKLEALKTELGGDTLVVSADLTKAADVDSAIRTVTDHFGQIDILFANAGSYVTGDVAEGDADQFDAVISVNVNAVFRMVRATLPGMIERRSGDIVVTSSISGHQAIHWEPIYSATKHAVQSFVHGVRRQVAPHNVRVGALAPGIVLNELWGLTDQAEIVRRVAAHEGLRCEDVADALVFMLTRPANATIRDLVILPQNQDI